MSAVLVLLSVAVVIGSHCRGLAAEVEAAAPASQTGEGAADAQTPASRPVAGPTPLAALAATLKPGEWAELQTKGLTYKLVSVTGREPITDYANSAAWDSRTRQFLFVGGGHGEPKAFVVYKERTNEWHSEPFPAEMKGTHGYDYSTVDFDRSVFYWCAHRPNAAWKLDLATNRWSPIPCDLTPPKMGGGEYFPEMKAIVFVAGGSVHALEVETQEWKAIKGGLKMGSLHALIEYNPVHKVVVFGGGNKTTAFYKMDASGAITPLKDAPVVFRVHGSTGTLFCVDPANGRTLILDADGTMYEHNLASDTWTRLDAHPPFRPIKSVVAPVRDHGVLMFLVAEREPKVFVYRHADARPAGAKAKN